MDIGSIIYAQFGTFQYTGIIQNTISRKQSEVYFLGDNEIVQINNKELKLFESYPQQGTKPDVSKPCWRQALMDCSFLVRIEKNARLDVIKYFNNNKVKYSKELSIRIKEDETLTSIQKVYIRGFYKYRFHMDPTIPILPKEEMLWAKKKYDKAKELAELLEPGFHPQNDLIDPKNLDNRENDLLEQNKLLNQTLNDILAAWGRFQEGILKTIRVNPPLFINSTSTPTVVPKPDFNAQEDSANLRKSMKGFGCDDTGLIDVICRRNNAQRQEIAKVFKTNFGKDLTENLQSETSGNFESLLCALMLPTLDFYCKEIHDACAGIGTDEQVLIEVLIEILCTLSNNEISMIRNRYFEIYKEDLEKVLIGKTSGNLKRLFHSLCTANRDESGVTDRGKAQEDVVALITPGELRPGTDETILNYILSQRNYAQLRLIFEEYETMADHSFEKAIEYEFDFFDPESDNKDGFTEIFRCVNNKAEFFAHQLMKSMKGLGTDDRQLIRIVVTRCEIDMGEIKEAFQDLFNESLRDCIKGDTSGAYKYGLYALIGEQRSS